MKQSKKLKQEIAALKECCENYQNIIAIVRQQLKAEQKENEILNKSITACEKSNDYLHDKIRCYRVVVGDLG